MRTIAVILGYLKWHYSRAIISLSIIWLNFLTFTAAFFSIRESVRNFFDPWKRLTDSYPKSFDLKKYLYAFLTNMIVRVFGMILRTGLIIIGLAAWIIVAVFYPAAVLAWLALPAIILTMFAVGIILIIK